MPGRLTLGFRIVGQQSPLYSCVCVGEFWGSFWRDKGVPLCRVGGSLQQTVKTESVVRLQGKYTEPSSSMKQRFWTLEPEAVCLITALIIVFLAHLSVSRGGLHRHINLQTPYDTTCASGV
jgi:hypothetical protein